MTDESSTMDAADQLLVVRCQLGERDAFDALVRRWAAPLERYTRRLAGDEDSARDLAQECWLRALRGLAGLRHPAQFRAWLFGIAYRLAMDRLRTRYAQPMASADALDGIAVEDEDTAEIQQAMDRGLALMPPAEREVLTLFYRQDLPLAAIAERLAIPPGTVKSRLFRARQLLRQSLIDQEPPHVR